MGSCPCGQCRKRSMFPDTQTYQVPRKDPSGFYFLGVSGTPPPGGGVPSIPLGWVPAGGSGRTPPPESFNEARAPFLIPATIARQGIKVLRDSASGLLSTLDGQTVIRPKERIVNKKICHRPSTALRSESSIDPQRSKLQPKKSIWTLGLLYCEGLPSPFYMPLGRPCPGLT